MYILHWDENSSFSRCPAIKFFIGTHKMKKQQVFGTPYCVWRTWWITESAEVLCCSVAQSCSTLELHGLQHARPVCPSPSPKVCPNSCPHPPLWPYRGEGACITQRSYEPCRATQDTWVLAESSDKTWSTGRGNGKPPQYTCREIHMNCIKRTKRYEVLYHC